MQNKFFGSKLNTVLLLVLIVLMVIAVMIMLRNESTYFSAWGVKKEIPISNSINKIDNNIPVDWIEYKNDEFGISFSYPISYGEVKIEFTKKGPFKELVKEIGSDYMKSFLGTFYQNKDFYFGGGIECWGCSPGSLQTGLKNQLFRIEDPKPNFQSNNGANAFFEHGSCLEDCYGFAKGEAGALFNLISSEYYGVQFIGPDNTEFYSIMKTVKIY